MKKYILKDNLTVYYTEKTMTYDCWDDTALEEIEIDGEQTFEKGHIFEFYSLPTDSDIGFEIIDGAHTTPVTRYAIFGEERLDNQQFVFNDTMINKLFNVEE